MPKETKKQKLSKKQKLKKRDDRLQVKKKKYHHHCVLLQRTLKKVSKLEAVNSARKVAATKKQLENLEDEEERKKLEKSLTTLTTRSEKMKEVNLSVILIRILTSHKLPLPSNLQNQEENDSCDDFVFQRLSSQKHVREMIQETKEFWITGKSKNKKKKEETEDFHQNIEVKQKTLPQHNLSATDDFFAEPKAVSPHKREHETKKREQQSITPEKHEKSFKIKTKVVSPKKPKSNELHPSWAARKQKSSLVRFEGQKIQFD